MLVRPSLVLQIMLKPEEYSEEAVEELKRSYIYLAQSIVSQADGRDAGEGNVMRLSIRLMRPYWDMGDPKAQELWEGVMPQWLRNVTRNVSTAMHNYNTVQHPAGVRNVVYDWVDFEFGRDALIRVKVDAENRIPQAMPDICDKVRALLNEGAFGDREVALIRVPSWASYESQLAVAAEETQARCAIEAQEAADGVSGVAGVAAAAVPSEDTPADAVAAGENAGGAFDLNSGIVADAALGEIGDAHQSGEMNRGFEYAAPSFNVNLDVWGIEYADGTIEEFDSRSA